MNRVLVTLIVVAVMFSAAMAMPRSHAPDPRNFWLLNNTDKEITEFYVSPHTSNAWDDNVLSTTLPSGLGEVIVFNTNVRSTCLMDFKLVYADGSSQIYTQGRNVCVLTAVQFNSATSVGLLPPE